MTTRIYIVTRNNGHHRLVRAGNQAQAIRYCVGKDYAAEVASQEALVGLLPHHAVEDARAIEAVGAEPQA